MYTVVDLEMCKVPKENKTEEFHWGHETIQIGAVLLDDNFEIINHFSSFVAPEFGVLDGFIERLTGISQKDLDDAPLAKDAIEAFFDWAGEDTTFVAWSDADYLQLQREIIGKDMDEKKYSYMLDEANWIDCQKLFDDKAKASHEYNLVQALNLAGIDYKDGVHNGYVDAYNTALLFKKLNVEENFKWSEYFTGKDSEEKSEPLSTSMGSLFAGLQFAE